MEAYESVDVIGRNGDVQTRCIYVYTFSKGIGDMSEIVLIGDGDRIYVFLYCISCCSHHWHFINFNRIDQENLVSKDF